MVTPSIDISLENGAGHPVRTFKNEDLIEGIIAGDPSAAKQFHMTYSASISRLVWRMLGDDPDHEEMVQQILVNVITNMRTIRKPESLDAWVKSVTLRVVRDELRRRKRQGRFLSNTKTTDDEGLPDPSSPWKHAQIRAFYGILNQMSPDDRIILVLKYLEGLSNEKVAELKGFSLSTAKRRLERAKSRFLKKAMSDLCLLSILD